MQAVREARAPQPQPRGFRKGGPDKNRQQGSRIKAGQALEAARRELVRCSQALSGSLGLDELRLGQPQAIEEAIAFLEAEVPGHKLGRGWGYFRESLLHRLKDVQLSPAQAKRLQKVALKLCLGQSYRRETRQAARLMIRLADEDFAARLAQVRADSMQSSQGAHQAALLMVVRLAHHRPEPKHILLLAPESSSPDA